MGPEEYCLELAREIKANWPSFTGDEYALAYCIQAWCKKNEALESALTTPKENAK